MTQLDPDTFFFKTPLYKRVEILEKDIQDFNHLLSCKYTIEAYNPSLKQESTFEISKHGIIGGNIPGKELMLHERVGFHQFDIKCRRNDFNIRFHVLLTCEDDNDNKANNKYYLLKIGQFPSIADLQISKIKQYDKVLDKEKLKEITRAVGLAANGVGIGSFVYLRRVFEHLIEEAHQVALKDECWNEELYQKNRMDEKIEQLKSYLPEFLVENKNMYGILSVGIHKLDENECLQYFDAIKVGIELILDEKVEKLNKKKKIKDAKERIQSINQNLKKK